MARTRKRTRAARREPERGIVLDVTGAELVSCIAQRIAWHREHGAKAAAQLKQMQAAEPAASLQEWQWRSEMKELRQRALEHDERGRFLAFVREHLSRKAVYRVGGVELRMMEIMPDSVHWW